VSAQLSESALKLLMRVEQVLVPGLVDAHTHDDLAVFAATRPLLLHKICQGITTVVIGHLWFWASAMVHEYVKLCKNMLRRSGGKDDQRALATMEVLFIETLVIHRWAECLALLAHGPVRVDCDGVSSVGRTSEQESWPGSASGGRIAGGCGWYVSFGYGLCARCDTTNWRTSVRLARIVGRYGGVIASHMRGEGRQCLRVVMKMLAIAEKAEAGSAFRHLKVTGRRNWGTVSIRRRI